MSDDDLSEFMSVISVSSVHTSDLSPSDFTDEEDDEEDGGTVRIGDARGKYVFSLRLNSAARAHLKFKKL